MHDINNKISTTLHMAQKEPVDTVVLFISFTMQLTSWPTSNFYDCMF